ncbi:MAG: hypothetical protein HY711_03715 [Candidatus Melainabacteria bacterium]|nr:hypothetical protein [Candidatus Melainabacteria bacterium]
MKRISCHRANHGNMFMLSVLAFGIIIVVFLAGFSVYLMFFSQSKAHSQSDQLALQVAHALNDQDEMGEMNNLVARCRELVFNSRKTHDAAHMYYQHLEPLANQLLEESRASACYVELERQRLVRHSLTNLYGIVELSDSDRVLQSGLKLPWLATKPARPVGLAVGYIDGVESNVEVSEGNPELNSTDLARHYIDRASKLYMGNINVKLPAPDNDLHFKLSSLPAPVKETVSPPRLTSPNVFVETARLMKDGLTLGASCDQLPSAVKVDMLIKVTTGPEVRDVHAIQTTSYASTCGASPLP